MHLDTDDNHALVINTVDGGGCSLKTETFILDSSDEIQLNAPNNAIYLTGDNFRIQSTAQGILINSFGGLSFVNTDDVIIDTGSGNVSVATGGLTGPIFNLEGATPEYQINGVSINLASVTAIKQLQSYVNQSGPKVDRPVSPPIGFVYFDTNVGLPIFFNGVDYIKADGTFV